MNILLTGGAGYIGSHVSLALLDLGHKVTIIDDLSTGHEKLIPKKANFIKTNITDSETLTNIIKHNTYDALMHFAGFIQVEESIENPEAYFTNNTKNSAILFENCLNNGLNNIIFSSTAAVYGNSNKKLVDEKTDTNPINPYAESKVLTEEFLKKLSKKRKLYYIILRYFNVAGADLHLRSGLISKKSTHLIKKAGEVIVGRKNSITIYGNDYATRDGTAIRDYIHVADLANIHVKFAEYLLKNKVSSIINCGYGKGYTVKEILDEMNKISNGKINIKFGERRKGDAASLVSNTNKLMKTIKWAPKYQDLQKILKSAINWEIKLTNEKIL